MQDDLIAPGVESVAVEGTDANFADVVLKASIEKPVIVDFWAPWCEPCKQYRPALEKAVQAEQGRVLLVTVNVDENPMVAGQLQVRSLPTTMPVVKGQPVDLIPGVLPAESLKKLLSQLLQMSGLESETTEVVKLVDDGNAALATSDFSGAERSFTEALTRQADNVDAVAGKIRALIGLADRAAVEAFRSTLTGKMIENPAVAQALSGLDLLGSGDDGAVTAAREALAAAPDDLGLKYALAEAWLEANCKAEAIDCLLEILAVELNWNDQAARHKLLEIFAALGFQDALAKSGRQRMSALLFR